MLLQTAEAIMDMLSSPLMVTMMPTLGRLAIATSSMHRMNIMMTHNTSNPMRSRTKIPTTRMAMAILLKHTTRDLLRPRPVVRTSMMNVSTTKGIIEHHKPTVMDTAMSA